MKHNAFLSLLLQKILLSSLRATACSPPQNTAKAEC